MAGPLVGIRVLDLGRFLAGPFIATLLADLGAEVIRVERSDGAEDRLFGYPAPCGDSYCYCNVNRNKKGISLNFERNAKAKEILSELVKRSDIVTHNFAPRAAEAIGVTYDDIRAVKPDILYAQVAGFGLTGPYSHRICFDPVTKAMSGIMSVTGPPGPPLRDLISSIDFGTASLAAAGVLAANIPLRMSGTPLAIECSFPDVGQDNEEVYGSMLGYSREDLARLKEEGVL